MVRRAQRFEGVLTSSVSAEAFDSAGSADALVNSVHTRHIGFSFRRHIAGRTRARPTLTGLLYYTCVKFSIIKPRNYCNKFERMG